MTKQLEEITSFDHVTESVKYNWQHSPQLVHFQAQITKVKFKDVQLSITNL